MLFQSLILIVLSILFLTTGLILLINKGKEPGSVDSIFMLVAIIIIWITANLLHTSDKTLLSLGALRSINYLCLSLAASSQLLFSLSYSKRSHGPVSVIFALLLIEPALTQILFWTTATRTIMFDTESRVWERINLIYSLYLLVISVLPFAESYLSKSRQYFPYMWTSFAGSIISVMGNILIFALDHDLTSEVYVSVFSYSLAVVGFSYGKLKSQFVELTELTRDAIIEVMDDGWMIVNLQNKIIDINASAEKMIGMSRKHVYNLPVEQILPNWQEMSKTSEGIKDIEMRRSVKDEKDWQYFSIRISQLSSKKNLLIGHLVTLQDVTGRKLADVVRQQVRDELFVLLHTLSNLASNTISLEEFLSEVNYQLIYSFNSQAIAVLLNEDAENDKTELILKSHFGLSPEQVRMLSSQKIRKDIGDWLAENPENRPLLIVQQHTYTNQLFNLTLMGFSRLVLIPLVTYTRHENNVLGCLCLGRVEDDIYSQDETVRLTMVGTQIATLIDSNRRKQVAIALNERQRLLRDLHDSVSQKLYGLVALTEAAQAGIEAGSPIATGEVLSRIGDNARQAVKEMRLFLYQMQPVDLKDGLIASLQHRLAAVEGRADIKARMVSDENIQLEREHEIALYYIAQEALNNILRHANARNVSVKLTQTRENVVLEIQDDGQGFEINKIDKSGLGLRNMRERATRSKAKLKITSKVKSGTKVVVSVARKVSP